MGVREKKREKERRKGIAPWKRVMTLLGILGAVLFLWTEKAEQNAHYAPDYPMEDITPYLEKGALTEADYRFLYQQTGLSRAAVDTLYQENRNQELLLIQKRLFADVKTVCKCHSFIFREELVWNDEEEQKLCAREPVIPAAEDGDIIITFNSHFFGWKNGHAGVVIDAEKGLTLEALTLGEDSAVLTLDSWADRPSFAVLRLRGVSKEKRSEIAAYAEKYLTGVPYRLTAGMWRDGNGNTEQCGSLETADAGPGVTGTQCSHLIWYAYRHFGYDLDSDGGLLVTPRDLYDSPLLETVQVYGIKIE